MLVNGAGLVTDAAIGKLTTLEETKLLSRLDVSSTAPPLFPRFAIEIDEEQFDNLRYSDRPTILDVRERHQRQESSARSVVNIPSREVQTRGPIGIVVDEPHRYRLFFIGRSLDLRMSLGGKSPVGKWILPRCCISPLDGAIRKKNWIDP